MCGGHLKPSGISTSKWEGMVLRMMRLTITITHVSKKSVSREELPIERNPCGPPASSWAKRSAREGDRLLLRVCNIMEPGAEPPQGARAGAAMATAEAWLMRGRPPAPRDAAPPDAGGAPAAAPA